MTLLTVGNWHFYLEFQYGLSVKKLFWAGAIAHVVCELFCFSVLCHLVACRPNCVFMKFGLRLGLLF